MLGSKLKKKIDVSISRRMTKYESLLSIHITKVTIFDRPVGKSFISHARSNEETDQMRAELRLL